MTDPAGKGMNTVSSVSTSATTHTAQVTASPNVHYTIIGESGGHTYSVTPHEPTPR